MVLVGDCRTGGGCVHDRLLAEELQQRLGGQRGKQKQDGGATMLAETPECWTVEIKFDSIFSTMYGLMLKLSANMYVHDLSANMTTIVCKCANKKGEHVQVILNFVH